MGLGAAIRELRKFPFAPARPNRLSQTQPGLEETALGGSFKALTTTTTTTTTTTMTTMATTTTTTTAARTPMMLGNEP